MKILTSELIDITLDWAVAKCEKEFVVISNTGRIRNHQALPLNYSTNWSQGGPIIEREIAQLSCLGDDGWEARGYTSTEYGDTPLIAAMRCYVASKLGNEVEVPDEIQ